MARFRQQTELGFRWIVCGWRLFRRHPWLLWGMGFSSALPIAVLLWVPFFGAPLVALLAPIFLASAYLAIDGFVGRKPARATGVRRWAALKESPRELIGVLRDEERLIPLAVFCLYSMIVTVLIGIVVSLIAGGAWSGGWLNLDPAVRVRVAAAGALALVIYLALAASLVYALPLAFLQKQPLLPAIERSVKASGRHAAALLVIFGLLLLPFLLGGVAWQLSFWAGWLLGLAAAAFVLPVAAAGLYGSYRTIFSAR